jgi:hypothetical protein
MIERKSEKTDGPSVLDAVALLIVLGADRSALLWSR